MCSFVLQILVALNDPERKDATIKEILSNVFTLEDESGNKHDLVNLCGLYFSPRLFRTREMLFLDTKRVQLLGDDIILASYPKTGNNCCRLFIKLCKFGQS